jgi:hypothetical protein
VDAERDAVACPIGHSKFIEGFGISGLGTTLDFI